MPAPAALLPLDTHGRMRAKIQERTAGGRGLALGSFAVDQNVAGGLSVMLPRGTILGKRWK
jgi:hypothetical protein